ncbi:MAG: cation:proton antiporter [Candidatus Methanomethylicia archaeon]
MIAGAEILLLFVFTVFLGYLSELFYDKTRVPDIIWLIFFGIFLGPVLHLYDPSPFIRASPIMSIIALCIIVFDAGIHMDFNVFLKSFPRSLPLTFLYYFLTIIIVGITSYMFMHNYLSLLECILLGAMFSNNAVTVSAVLRNLESSSNVDLNNIRNILLLESILSDSIAFITVITIIRLIITPYMSIIEGFENVFLSFIFSLSFGSLGGILWSFILNKLSHRKFNYILTMAMVFFVYVFSEELVEGSGVLSLLFYALLIVNSDTLFEKFGLKDHFIVDSKHLREFHEEMTFLLKSFFFVFVGLIMQFSFEHVFFGLIVSLVMFGSRVLCTIIYDFMFKLNHVEKFAIMYTFTNGLSTLVMSRLPSVYDPNKLFFRNSEIYTNICFITVFVTVLLGIFIVPYMISRNIKSINKG